MATDHVFSIMGKKIRWRYARLRGQADGWTYYSDPPGTGAQDRVVLNEKLKGRARLETEIHEFFHLVNPSLSESHVTQAAADLARILYALGYRKTENPCG